MTIKTRFNIVALLWTWAFFLKRRTLVRINYKSGIQEKFWVYYFWRHLNENNRLTEIKWIPVNAYVPFILGLDEIESVWIIETRGVFSMPESLEPTS